MSIPTEIHWEITNACNLSCETCIQSSGKPRPHELSTEKIKQILRIFAQNHVLKICFTGGEPFSRKDFLEILSTTVGLGMAAEVITNATLLTPQTLDTIALYGAALGISLDGSLSESNDCIRGDGSFVKTMLSIKQAVDRNIPVHIYVTVTSLNIQELEEMSALTTQLGCSGIHFSEVTLAGRALTSSKVVALTLKKHNQLPALINRIARKIYNEKLKHLDESCWIDADSAWYVRSDGEIYTCSEIGLRRPEKSLGNIQSLVLKHTGISPQPKSSFCSGCSYNVWASEHVTLITNTWNVCPLTRSESQIQTIQELYGELDAFYPDIRQFCADCHDPDCMGYTWVLPEEADRLIESNIPIVQINDGANFIHSFMIAEDGSINVEARYPVCRYAQDPCRKCGIYKQRPMVCRLWPIGLETHEGKVVLALHLDCLFVRYLQEHDLIPRFKRSVLNLMTRLSPELKEEIVSTYFAVDAITKFPDGENRYIILQEF